MIVVERDDTTVVAETSSVTVVGASPLNVVVTELNDNVTVVSNQQQLSVVTLPLEPVVIPVNQTVTVVAGNDYTGPKIFFSNTPPSGAKLNDIWIRTA